MLKWFAIPAAITSDQTFSLQYINHNLNSATETGTPGGNHTINKFNWKQGT